MDRGRYTDLFVEESREHLESAGQLAADVARGAGSEEDLRKLFRHAHSIKGLAACMGYTSLADLSHAAEDLLEALRSGETALHGPWSSLLLEAFACMGRMVEHAARGGEGDDPERSRLIHRMADLRGRPATSARGPAARHPAPPDRENARARAPRPVPAEKLDFRRSGRRSWVRVPTHRVDELLALAGRLNTLLPRVEADGGDALAGLRAALGRLERLADEIGLVPFGAIADRIGEAAADLTRDRGRYVRILVEGGNIRIERSLADRLFEALLHLVRNAVAHGLETPGERARRGKQRDGRLTLCAARRGGRLVVSVEDDGRGMDAEALRRAALARGLIQRDDAASLSHRELLQLATLPGVSTSASPNRMAGRGTGLDVVREIAVQLGGSIKLASRPGHGTRVELRLPIGVARVEVVVVETSGVTCAIPVPAVEAAGADPPLAATRPPEHAASWLRVRAGGRFVLIEADRIVGRRWVLVQPLGAPLDAHPLYTGAALLPGGAVALVVDPDALPGSPLPVRV